MTIDLQHCVMTRGVGEFIKDSDRRGRELLRSFNRLAKCDYGELCKEDARRNAESVKCGYGMVMGIYSIEDTTIWIISYLGEGGYTTALFPEEY